MNSVRQHLETGVAAREPLDTLYRCGQFVLGREPLPVPANWPRVTIGGTRVLRAHPELAVTQHGAGAATLTLIGNMLDPERPSAGNREILEALSAYGTGRDALLRATAPCGGRWVLIANDGEESFLFHDALGLRQACFARDAAGAIHVASDPGMLAQIAHAPVDAEARVFAESAVFRNDPERAWPAAATAFRGVHRLLPNHWLDLARGSTTRFWPDGPLVPVGLEQAAEHCAALVRGLITAAARRFELVVAVTAGLDSRVVLAASRDLGERVEYVTVHQWHVANDPPDVDVARRMMAALGLGHAVVRAAAEVDSRFDELFRANTATAHEHYLPDAAALLARFGRRKAAITGSGGELGRCSFREHLPLFDRLRVTPHYLARIGGYGTERFAVRALAAWLDGTQPRHGINPLDLFMWEHDCGSWLAMVQLEFDIAWREIFTPFDCRELLATMLATQPAQRKGPRSPLFQEMIRRLWPELLEFPINPHHTATGARAWLRHGVELMRYAVHPLRHGPWRQER